MATKSKTTKKPAQSRLKDLVGAAFTAPKAETQTITPTDVAVVKLADLAAQTSPERDAYAGNISYVNHAIKNADQVYCTIVVRMKNDSFIEDVVVGAFVNKNVWGIPSGDKDKFPEIGDTVAVRAMGIVAGNTTLEDGTPVHKFRAMDRKFGVQVLFKRPKEVEVTQTEAIESEGLLSRLSNVKAGVLSLFGLAPKADA